MNTPASLAPVRLYTLGYREMKTYLFASLFVIGNILLPQLAHLVPGGGFIFLPIYFFTLIASYKYGWKAGLMTAVFSPLANHLLFGMPPLAVLPVILIKSLLLVAAASLMARRFDKITLPILLGVVLGYQLPGTFAEWLLLGDFSLAIQDFRLGIPGMLLQIFGGYLIIGKLLRK